MRVPFQTKLFCALIFSSFLILVSIPASVFAVDQPGNAEVRYSPADDQGRYRYVVTLGEEGAIQMVASGEVSARSGSVEDAKALARQAIQADQFNAIQSVGSMLEREVKASHYLQMSQNAIGLRLTEQEAERVLSLPQVISVERERVYQLDTYRGPEFIGVDQIWDGSAVPSGQGLLGRGMIAAILDSGTNEDHPSFANVASCGHGANGVPDKLISSVDCSATDGSGRCNGADSSDTGAHGSHVASTVAGNVVLAADDPNLNLPFGFTQITGVAPCAHLRTYKVCPTNTCPFLDIQAGMQNVLLDGDASVMNFSISGGASPWVDNDRVKLDIVDAGIFVAASAGNNSQDNPVVVGRVNHRGPWVMSVAASTRDGDFSASMSLTNPGTPPPATQNIVMDQGSVSPPGMNLQDHPIRVDTNQAPGAEGCNVDEGGVEFPPGFFSNAVALIQRGGCSFTNKINNAAAAGADLVVIWNNAPELFGMLTNGQAMVPAYSISGTDGQAVSDFVLANPTTAEMDFTVIPIQGDVLADFSLRGPTAAPLADLQKPNITGPGVSIFAADRDPLEYGFKGGTSMSSPHVAGAALLVRQANPLWTPMEVKSALQMTAIQSGFKENQVTQWDWDDVGSGRVDLTQAALAGLVIDESFANFLAANPAQGGDVRTLNLPSVRDRNCDPECTWTRTVSATLPVETSWTISAVGDGFDIDVQPSTFTLAGRADTIFEDGFEIVSGPAPGSSTQELTITVSNVNAGPIRFGVIDMTEDSAQAPDAHITVAVQR